MTKTVQSSCPQKWEDGPPKTRLERLLRPQSIAIIGGGTFAANAVSQCLKMGFTGQIWPVHPGRDEVAGVSAFRSVAELPAAPDASFIGVNRHLTIDIIRELAGRNAGGAVCFAAGFRETGEADGVGLQDELIAAAGPMPLIGPNCYGLINYADGALLWPDQHGGRRLAKGEKGVAIITQSSNIAINLTMQRRGLPLAYVLTAGNQAQTGLSEIALGLIEDERVSALGLHIEGFDCVSGFERLAARAQTLRKPIVAMKVGRSEQARAATISHTASLAGSDAASDAFLRRLGIARVNSIPAFLETLKLLHVAGPLSGRRLSSMSCSGGEASVMADAAEGRGVFFPRLEEEHAKKVSASLGPLVAIANPLDYHTFIWNDEKAMADAFTAMISGGFDLNLLVLDFPRSDRCCDAAWWPPLNAFMAALKANTARGAVIASMPENLPEDYCAQLIARGVTPLAGIVEAIDASEAAAAIGDAWNRPFPSPQSERTVQPSAWDIAAMGATPDEADAKALLRKAGLTVPQGKRVASVEDAVSAAQTLGFPVALKALGIAHKSELEAVRLKLTTPAAVRAAAEALLPLGTGLYVERMIEGGIAELIVGITHDPLFGPVMTIGTGGILVELLEDVATLILPAERSEVEAGLRGLKLFALLDGYRGRARADLDAALDAIMSIARFATDHADRIGEIEINPLIVCAQGQGAWVADALLVASSSEESAASSGG